MSKSKGFASESPVPPARPDGPQAFRWRLDGADLPPLTMALRVGEATRAAIYKACEQAALWPLPEAFHRGREDYHEHAYWLPEDADGDGLIDHVVLFAESGLPDALAPVLAGGGPLWLWRAAQWRLLPDWMGRRAPGALFGPARAWRTATPYVQPNWGKGAGRPRLRDPVADHLAHEIEIRKLPAPLAIEAGSHVAGGQGLIEARAFVLSTTARRAFGDAVPAGVRLVFAQPVWGPLAFGFGAHFGLGLFEPADEGLF